MAEAHELGLGDIQNVEESVVGNHWVDLARKHWPKPVTSKKVKPEVISKDIWQPLAQEDFNFRSLLLLENLQLLEK